MLYLLRHVQYLKSASRVRVNHILWHLHCQSAINNIELKITTNPHPNIDQVSTSRKQGSFSARACEMSSITGKPVTKTWTTRGTVIFLQLVLVQQMIVVQKLYRECADCMDDSAVSFKVKIIEHGVGWMRENQTETRYFGVRSREHWRQIRLLLELVAEISCRQSAWTVDIGDLVRLKPSPLVLVSWKLRSKILARETYAFLCWQNLCECKLINANGF